MCYFIFSLPWFIPAMARIVCENPNRNLDKFIGYMGQIELASNGESVEKIYAIDNDNVVLRGSVVS